MAVTGLTGVIAIGIGQHDTCALLGDGTVRCWGFNGVGQLGDGTTSNRSTPVAVTGLSGVTAIAVGGYSTCALRADTTVRCWGFNAVASSATGRRRRG